MKRPSAWIPIAMSVGALAVVLGSIAVSGGVIHREADEGAFAHIYQLLIAGQAPLVVFHAVKWLPRAPKPGLQILAAQAGATLAAIVPVYWLGL